MRVVQATLCFGNWGRDPRRARAGATELLITAPRCLTALAQPGEIGADNQISITKMQASISGR